MVIFVIGMVFFFSLFIGMCELYKVTFAKIICKCLIAEHEETNCTSQVACVFMSIHHTLIGVGTVHNKWAAL